MSKYMSVIMTGRNDDYAIGFLDRFQKSLDMWSYLAGKHKFYDLEMVLVEWNPLPGKVPLKDVLKLPKNIDCRIITVPNEVHKSLPPTQYDAANAEKIPFYEFHGKNAAARRCDSQFLMLTNPDIIYNNELVKFFSEKTLKPKRFYRIDREALVHQVNGSLSFEDQLKACAKDVDPRSIAKNDLCKKRYIHTKSSGDFTLVPKSVFEKAKGYLEIRCGGAAIDRFGLYCIRTVCKQKIIGLPKRAYHQPHQKRADLYLKKTTKEEANMEYESDHGTFSRKDVKQWFTQCYSIMEKTGENKNINPDNWGLIDHKLPEEFFPRSKK